jgi:hypothetical protein
VEALIHYNFFDRLGSADFSDSPTVQSLAAGESRIPVFSFQIALQESCAHSSAPDLQKLSPGRASDLLA